MRIVTDVKTDEFSLVETLAYIPKTGFTYLEGHMLRLMRSAHALGYRLDIDAVFTALDRCVANKTKAQRVRLVCAPNGLISVTTRDLSRMRSPLRVRLSANPPRALDGYSFAHKSTPMPFYDKERARLKTLDACDELIFVRPDGHITEGSFTTVFVQIDGALFTPPLSAGILPGVLRAHLLEVGKAKIKDLKLSDLQDANALYLGNSVRGLCPAILENLTPL